MAKKTPLNEDALEFFRKAGASGGRKGGKARMETLTKEQRREFAKKGAAARWGKKKKDKQ